MLGVGRPAQMVEADLAASIAGLNAKANSRADPLGVRTRDLKLECHTRLILADPGPPVVIGPEPQLVFASQSWMASAPGRPPLVKIGGRAYGAKNAFNRRLDWEIVEDIGHGSLDVSDWSGCNDLAFCHGHSNKEPPRSGE